MPEITISVKNLSDDEAQQLLAKHNIALTVEEAREIEEKFLGRPMTLTESLAWSIEGSEHCSYKSSKRYLKLLPTKAPNVILGPQEDAGIVEIARLDDERIGIVIAHESHNHPSQVVPYEGAATGIGGIVRDVVCMGAKVIALADPLRFGNINLNKSHWLARGIIEGIGGYGNAIGVPNLAGDVYFNDSFNENCLVNVVALGLVKESEIIRSRAPKDSIGHNMILVGKPTDNSGFGGAAFASLGLDEADKEKNKGAVQEPNAFLKKHLLESTYDLFNILRGKKLLAKVGFKDLGGGGILCATAEMVEAAGLGAEVNLDQVPVAMPNLPAHILLCAETQERFLWIAPPVVTALIIDHYNKRWALPRVSHGAQAKVIGQVKAGDYVVKYRGETVVQAQATDICQGLNYKRPIKSKKRELKEPQLPEPDNYSHLFKKLLAHENVANRSPIFERYDKTVQGLTIIEPGQADAGVMAPLIDFGFLSSTHHSEFISESNKEREVRSNNAESQDESEIKNGSNNIIQDNIERIRKVGIALSVDSNPFYSLISPYWGAVNAVVEAMRNVAAVGATPWALTDCLNYGNPERPKAMWQFAEGVRGVSEAAKNIHLKGFNNSPTPVISGNVSLYNESPKGAVAPSAIIACLGRLEDYKKAITFVFKKAGSEIYLIGERNDELGGSAYYQLYNELGANVPKPDFKEVEKQIYAVTDMVEQGLLLSCHDISDGGLAVCLAEMSFGGDGNNRIGIDVDILNVSKNDLPIYKKLFSETGGFVLETKQSKSVKKVCGKYGINLIKLGQTIPQPRFIVRNNNVKVINEEVNELADKWLNGLRNKLS